MQYSNKSKRTKLMHNINYKLRQYKYCNNCKTVMHMVLKWEVGVYRGTY